MLLTGGIADGGPIHGRYGLLVRYRVRTPPHVPQVRPSLHLVRPSIHRIRPSIRRIHPSIHLSIFLYSVYTTSCMSVLDLGGLGPRGPIHGRYGPRVMTPPQMPQVRPSIRRVHPSMHRVCPSILLVYREL